MSDNSHHGKIKGWTDFHTTTLMASIVAFWNFVIIFFGGSNSNKIILIGIVTFFGMLIVSAYHEHAKKRSSIKKKKDQSQEKPATAAPSAPVSLAALPGDSKISLSWKSPSEGSPVTGYKIYRGTATGTETILATVGTVLSYTDKGLTNDTAYYYKVSAINSVGEGSQSTESSATPKAGKGTDTVSDAQDGPKKWEGEIMRTSIAGTLILVYVIVIGFTIFPVGPNGICGFSGDLSTHMNQTNSSSTNNDRESTTCQSVLNNFGNVIIVVIAFYFGSKAAIQIYQTYKGKDASASSSTDK